MFVENFKHEKCSLINFNFVDYFYQNKLVTKTGDNKMSLPVYYGGKEYQNLM